MITLSRLFIYPIKSTAPLELPEAQVEEQGLAHDRRYIVTDPRGRFFTARRFPRMVLIRATPHQGGLRVTAPGKPELQLHPDEHPDDYESIRVWRDVVPGQRCGDHADAWFSDYLGVPARLFYMGEQTHRPAFGGGEVSFADSAPLLLLSAASVADLNTRLANPVGIRNFRPNLVVSGSSAYAEDDWPDFAIGEVRFRTLRRCARCVLTTVDPDTAVMDPQRQPLATLMDYRRDGDDALFGRNVAVARAGKISVGEPLQFPD